MPTYPVLQDEALIQSDPKVEMRVSVSTRPSTFLDRFKSFTPGLMLQIFALIKFGAVLYIATNRQFDEKEIPIVVFVLGVNAFILFSATCQDFCTLILSWIVSMSAFVLYILLLVTVPIFVTSFFASDAARSVRIPAEWKIFRDIINYQSVEERRFTEGINYGMSVEFFLAILVTITAIQFILINATLNAKVDDWKRQKQIREKRNSVYLI
ncbi:hypothetical protein GCK72_009580 [Caenorhabditis remanei]|uniref:Uncharacterized protein n=1 Tax=Caenorhabditis remanei TaxID=31234 RepID=A0A6A5H3G1_CAERE|nr:hypothetical protein GCK72_009580 [Caenorhabditis remanei]KAF1761324.1 hypothetical protein GCK72_009580 [Caenorhabditis remanei]